MMRSIFTCILPCCFVARIVALIPEEDYTCNLENDSCRLKNNDVCNDKECGSQSDCFDCNYSTCHQFSTDCESCVSVKGCYWCAGDARCYNSPFYGEFGAPDYGEKNPRPTACPDPQDFLSGDKDACLAEAKKNYYQDPLSTSENWVFDMINVVPVWEKGFSGDGVRVRINDGLVDKNNPELSSRYDSASSCTTDGETDGSSSDAEHASIVASILAGEGNNGLCSVGISPGATISSCNIFSGDLSELPSILSEKVDSFDISQNSWQHMICAGKRRNRRYLGRHLQKSSCPFQSSEGVSSPCDACDFTQSQLSQDCEESIYAHCADGPMHSQDRDACHEYLDLFVEGCFYQFNRDMIVDAIREGIEFGRNGKGIIYTLAAGNFHSLGVDVNMDRLLNTRYTIPVGAVDRNGLHASYSNTGTALFVSAPGGDTTSRFNFPVPIFNDSGNLVCTDSGYGTSFACPVVSAVIALMLEANPDLFWRDVQAILAFTSNTVHDPNDISLVTNAAGYSHSDFYGFGIIDAFEAVRTAISWKTLPPEITIEISEEELDLFLPDTRSDGSDSTTELELMVEANANFVAESVEVALELSHISRGDLEVVLTSPSNTKSILHPGKRIEKTFTGEGDKWVLLTVRNWGESPIGKWKLSIRDLREGSLGDCADQHFYIDEFAMVCNSFKTLGACLNGSLNSTFWQDPSFAYFFSVTDETNGKNFQEACCVCGGGQNAATFQNVLHSWNLRIHGHIAPRKSSPASPASPARKGFAEPLMFIFLLSTVLLL